MWSNAYGSDVVKPLTDPPTLCQKKLLISEK